MKFTLARPAVLIMFPMMELHWKKKKKIPKNLTTQGSELSLLMIAILIKYTTVQNRTSNE